MAAMRYSAEQAGDIISSFLSVHSVEPIGFGNHSEAFCINGDTVVKLPKHRKASACLATEMRVLRRLEGQMPLDIPNVLWEGTFSIGGENYVFFASKLLRGRNLSKTAFARLDADIWEHNAAVIAHFLHCLHLRRDILPVRRRDMVLLHGDFSLNHILFDDDGIACGVLDFGDSRVGRPQSDFVYLLDNADDEEFGADFGRRVWELYQRCQ